MPLRRLSQAEAAALTDTLEVAKRKALASVSAAYNMAIARSLVINGRYAQMMPFAYTIVEGVVRKAKSDGKAEVKLPMFGEYILTIEEAETVVQALNDYKRSCIEQRDNLRKAIEEAQTIEELAALKFTATEALQYTVE